MASVENPQEAAGSKGGPFKLPCTPRRTGPSKVPLRRPGPEQLGIRTGSPRGTARGARGEPRLARPDRRADAAEGAAGTCVMESPKSNTRGQSRALPLAARSHSDMVADSEPAGLRRMWRSLAPWAELTVGGASPGPSSLALRFQAAGGVSRPGRQGLPCPAHPQPASETGDGLVSWRLRF